MAATRAEKIELGGELAQVISNELTVKTLVYLVERAGSPKDIGAHLDEPTSKVSHHVKKLERLGMVELIEEKDLGGTIQHIYRAIVRPIVSNEEWGKLDLAVRQQYSIWIVRMILADAATSFNAELFDAHPNRHLSRAPLLLDAEGLNRVAEIQNRALTEIIEEEVASIERRIQSGDPGIHVIAAMMCFALPEASQGLAGGPRCG